MSRERMENARLRQRVTELEAALRVATANNSSPGIRENYAHAHGGKGQTKGKCGSVGGRGQSPCIQRTPEGRRRIENSEKDWKELEGVVRERMENARREQRLSRSLRKLCVLRRQITVPLGSVVKVVFETGAAFVKRADGKRETPPTRHRA